MVLKSCKKFFVTSFFLLICSSLLPALEVPALTGQIVDNAGIINADDEAQMLEYLESLENSTGIQIAVLTIPSLEGEELASYSIKVAKEWKLGQADKDNGALLLVAYDEHQLRIEVGYGLEGLLTDAKCGLIIRNVIVPEFKNGNYSEGILKGVQNMGGIASEDAELVSPSVRNAEEGSDSGIGYIIIWLIFILILISTRSKTGRYSTHAPIITTTSPGYHSSGFHYSGGSSHHFSGGGGHFGGGGASGHW